MSNKIRKSKWKRLWRSRKDGSKTGKPFMNRPPKTKRSYDRVEKVYTRPRFTSNVGANVSAKGPDSRIGWCMFLIVIIVLILILPTLLVEGIQAGAAHGFDNLMNWLSNAGQNLGQSFHDFWAGVASGVHDLQLWIYHLLGGRGG